MITTVDRSSTHDPAEGGSLVSYAIDSAHSRAHFKVRHLMVAFVRGELGTVTRELLFNDAVPSQSRVTAVIDAAGIDTRNPDRDAHLRSIDFLDVANYPTVTFQSTAAATGPQGTFDVSRDLTIRGVTRPATLSVELSEEIRDPWGNVKRGVTATTRINRKDFGVSWNANLDAGGVVVADQVDITIEGQVGGSRADPAAPVQHQVGPVTPTRPSFIRPY